MRANFSLFNSFTSNKPDKILKSTDLFSELSRFLHYANLILHKLPLSNVGVWTCLSKIYFLCWVPCVSISPRAQFYCNKNNVYSSYHMWSQYRLNQNNSRLSCHWCMEFGWLLFSCGRFDKPLHKVIIFFNGACSLIQMIKSLDYYQLIVLSIIGSCQTLKSLTFSPLHQLSKYPSNLTLNS